MKLTIERDILAVALGRVTPIVSRSTIPILANIKLTAAGSSLSVLANNLSQAATQAGSALIDRPGEATVQADKFTALVNSLPRGSQLEIEAAERKLTARYGRNGHASFVTLPVEDFPAMRPMSEAEPFQIEALELHRLLAMTLPCASDEQTRPYLNGVYLAGVEKTICAVATDGSVLTLGVSSCEAAFAGIIVPREACAPLIRILASASGEVSVRATETALSVEIGVCSFQTKLVDGTFPEYRRVIPERVEHPILIEAGVLAEIAERAQAVTEAADATKARPRSIVLRAAGSVLAFEAGSTADQFLQEEIEIAPIPASVEIALATEYVLKGIAALGGEGQLELHITAANNPLLMTRVGNEAEVVVIMPRRM